MNEEDKILVERCLKADESAYRELLARYRAHIYTLCLRMVRNRTMAEDIAQEAFIRAFSALGTYDPSYPFSHWLDRIASNLCIDHLRKEKHRMVSLDEPAGANGDLVLELPDKNAGPERETESREMFDILEDALGHLQEYYRIIVILRYQEQLSYDEISRTLNIPVGTVKARIHRARSFIVEYFRKRGISPENLEIGGE